jgi:hypothetical protein
MKTFKIPSIWPFSFYQEEPTAIRVFPCPACKETISADANNCRFCHLPIDAATAERLLLENQRVTNAVADANTFRLSISLAALVILWWIIGVLTKDPSPAVFLPLVGIGYGALWLYRYRSLTTSDVDYPLAVKRVKRITLIWLLTLVLPWGISKLSFPEHRLVTQETIEIQGTDPPVFVLSGPGNITYFGVGVFSPALPEKSPNRVQIIWEIFPQDIFGTNIESVGQIDYGTVPPGFLQKTPANGPPPPLAPLEPGKYYVFYLLTMGVPRVMGAFEMKDGKTSRVYGLPFCVEFNEKGEGVWTRCRGDENPAK